MSKLKTRWTDKVNYDCPLNEYPRPQLVRNDWQCLNGKYEFTITAMTDDIPQNFSFCTGMLSFGHREND